MSRRNSNKRNNKPVELWHVNDCGKRAYPSRAIAKKAARTSRSHGGRRSVYLCQECDLFHLTSKSARLRTSIKNGLRYGGGKR